MSDRYPFPAPRPVQAVRVYRALGREYASPRELYRHLYKYTSCGPTLGLEFADGSRLYNDTLPALSWAEMTRRRLHVRALVVSSIVEDSEAVVPPVVVPCSPTRTLADRLHAAVQRVNYNAQELWNDAHGDLEGV